MWAENYRVTAIFWLSCAQLLFLGLAGSSWRSSHQQNWIQVQYQYSQATEMLSRLYRTSISSLPCLCARQHCFPSLSTLPLSFLRYRITTIALKALCLPDSLLPFWTVDCSAEKGEKERESYSIWHILTDLLWHRCCQVGWEKPCNSQGCVVSLPATVCDIFSSAVTTSWQQSPHICPSVLQGDSCLFFNGLYQSTGGLKLATCLAESS